MHLRFLFRKKKGGTPRFRPSLSGAVHAFSLISTTLLKEPKAMRAEALKPFGATDGHRRQPVLPGPQLPRGNAQDLG